MHKWTVACRCIWPFDDGERREISLSSFAACCFMYNVNICIYVVEHVFIHSLFMEHGTDLSHALRMRAVRGNFSYRAHFCGMHMWLSELHIHSDLRDCNEVSHEYKTFISRTSTHPYTSALLPRDTLARAIASEGCWQSFLDLLDDNSVFFGFVHDAAIQGPCSGHYERRHGSYFMKTSSRED
jgi:hypothetical protein